jgi:uncharacterized RDD family membrane protein YckC
MTGRELNPYAAPRADGPAPWVPTHLAGRGTRLGAAIIDTIAALAVNVPIGFALGFYDGFPNMELSVADTLLSAAIGFGVFVAIQLYFLQSGQTLGKRLLSIRMVDHETGRAAPVSRLVLLRYLPITLVANIPFVGGLLALVDVLFIFSSERRCLHDLIARTKVVVAGFEGEDDQPRSSSAAHVHR